MRSISRRAGWSMVAKKSGSPTATRSTGICRRANQTRTVAGMRSSVRMLWNSSATISIVARSTGVVAACFSACLRWCSSSSSAGVPIAGAPLLAAAAAALDEAPGDAVLRLGDRRVQPRRRRLPARCEVCGEVGQLAADQPVQAAEHRLGLVGAARQAGGAGHQPRLLADLVRLGRGRLRRRLLEVGGRGGDDAGRRAEAAARAGARGRRPAVVRAADERPQVDLGQHVALRAASGWSRGRPLRRSSDELVVQHGCSTRQASRPSRRAQPGVGDDARQHVRAQHVVGVELLAASRARSCASAGR